MPTIEILISGEVQGVFFRVTAKDIADELGIKGWVKNTEDGNVQAIATGTQQQLDKFVKWCKQGPPKAKVENMKLTEVQEQTFNTFKVLR
jgi:acylphosphatase